MSSRRKARFQGNPNVYVFCAFCENIKKPAGNCHSWPMVRDVGFQRNWQNPKIMLCFTMFRNMCLFSSRFSVCGATRGNVCFVEARGSFSRKAVFCCWPCFENIKNQLGHCYSWLMDRDVWFRFKKNNVFDRFLVLKNTWLTFPKGPKHFQWTPQGSPITAAGCVKWTTDWQRVCKLQRFSLQGVLEINS